MGTIESAVSEARRRVAGRADILMRFAAADATYDRPRMRAVADQLKRLSPA